MSTSALFLRQRLEHWWTSHQYHPPIQRISTQATERDGQAAVVAEIYSVERADRAMQEVMSRLNIEPSVTAVSWEKVQGTNA